MTTWIAREHHRFEAAGKPFVYYSNYVPSSRIVDLARRYGIRFLWRSLNTLPGALLERHRTWRQLWLSESQWETLAARLANPRANSSTLKALIL